MSPARRDWHSRSQGSCRNRRHRACCRADARTQMLLIVGLMLQGLAAEPFSRPPLTTPMSLSPSALRPVATLAMLPSELLSRARAGRPTAQDRLRYRRDRLLDYQYEQQEDPSWPAAIARAIASCRHVRPACVCLYAASFPVLCLQRGPAAMHASRNRLFSAAPCRSMMLCPSDPSRASRVFTYCFS